MLITAYYVFQKQGGEALLRCRVGVWRCKEALKNLCIPILLRCSNKVNIIGISFPSFIFPLSLLSFSSFLLLFLLHPSPPWDHCVGWCATLCLWFAHLNLWACNVADRIVSLVWPNNFIKLEWQIEACQVVAWDIGAACGCLVCVLFPCLNLCTDIYSISQELVQINICEHSVWLQQRAEYILHVMSEVNSLFINSGTFFCTFPQVSLWH